MPAVLSRRHFIAIFMPLRRLQKIAGLGSSLPKPL
jgi:hypothetical protein